MEKDQGSTGSPAPTKPGFMIAVLLIVAAFPSIAVGQKDTGGIAGIVRDPGGAVVSGAKVTVTDVDRGTELALTTNMQGEYVASPLKIGQYKLTVEKEGFRKTIVGPVVVNIQGHPAVDITLQVGSVAENVTVTTLGPQLETETSDLGQIISSRRAITLPLNGRNYAQLALLGAGIAPSEPGSRTETSFGFSSNGARALQNNFLLDGVDNNANLGDVLNGSAYVIQPSVDAIAEFKVQTNAYSAEFGRGNGAVMNAVIKSGTNGLHGDVYEFLRNEKLDARNAFDVFGRQPYKQNQFGFTLGGPIVKNRTFFFLDYEGLRIRQGLPQTLLVPTPFEIHGDFSSFLNLSAPIAGVVDCSGNLTYAGEIFNTRLTQVSAANSSGYCGVPIATNGAGQPTNIFPSSGPSAIHPVAGGLAALLPTPNYASNGNNFITDPRKQTEQNNFDIRVDQTISPKDNFFARFSYEDQPIRTPGPFNNALDGGGFADGNQDNSYRSVAISETHAFAQTLVNELRLGYNRINSHRLEPGANSNISSQLGLVGVPFQPGIGGLPSMGFTSDGNASIGSSQFLPSVEKQNSYVLNENLIWVRGRHSMKYGMEFRKEQFTIFQPSSPRGQLSFGPDLTDNPGAPGTGGEDFASFLLGLPDGGQIVSLHNVDYHRNTYAVYGQDDIQLTPRLTLNLGLRYEMFRPITEGHNQQATFDFASNSLILPKGQSAQLTPFLSTIIPIHANAPRGLINPDLGDVAPRLGLAYKITQKLVLRTGYGIFYGGQEDGPFSNPSPGFNPPFFATQNFNSQCGSAPLFPNANSADPTNCSIGYNPSAPVPTSLMINNFWAGGFPSGSLNDPNSPNLYSIDPHLKTPFTQQWHLGLQYQLPSETVFELSYAGSKGQRLYAFYNGNQLPGGVAGLRPFPALNNQITPISTLRSNGDSNYDSLQVRLEKRLTHGLTFQLSYTYSHSLDDASSASLGSLNNGDFRDQRHPGLEYGNADFDVRHRFVASYIYELPFGKGKALAGNASGVLNQVIGNWQVAGITSISTGNYFTISDPANPMGVDCGGTVTYNCGRPNQVGNPNGRPCVAGAFFNTCAFISNTGLSALGNEGRNVVGGPGFHDWDISLFKIFPVREEMRFEFRAELFNVWNHTNLLWGPIGALGQAEPVAIEVGTPQFGFAQAARDPRLVQFALKFYF